MLRIVLDTSVIVAALRSRFGAGNAVLRHVAAGEFVPLVTPALFLEYEEVLKRPEQRQVHGLNADQLDRFLAALASACEPVEIHFQWRPQLNDPADEMVLEAAINGRADALVTYNIRDFREAARRFRLQVISPATLLQEIER